MCWREVRTEAGADLSITATNDQQMVATPSSQRVVAPRTLCLCREVCLVAQAHTCSISCVIPFRVLKVFKSHYYVFSWENMQTCPDRKCSPHTVESQSLLKTLCIWGWPLTYFLCLLFIFLFPVILCNTAQLKRREILRQIFLWYNYGQAKSNM